jgi:predicted enzyme related to lactoylglutathione lyase
MGGRVTGIGGIFFRANDPEALAPWYKEHLDVPSFGPWPQEPGMSVFAPFQADTDYFAPDRQWMLNLRVEGLDELVAGLEAKGIPAERRDEWDDPNIGRFARIHDPEGNAIELWEPPSA